MITINAVVPKNYSWFFINDANDEIDELLHEELSYYVENAERTPSYQQGNWDGYVRLYKKNNHGAPVGLIDRSKNLLEEYGYDLQVEWQGNRQGDLVEFEWNFEHELRDYQERAVTALIDNGGGIIGLPTGAGKTITALQICKRLEVASGRPIVFVHTKELLYQWQEVIENVLGVEPGLIGDGKFSEGPITVCVMQTLMSRGTNNLQHDYGVMIFDECHRTSAADTMHDIGMEIDVDVRVGLSATPWRRVEGESLKIEAAVGGQVISIDAEALIDDGYLVKPEFEVLSHTGNQDNYNLKYHDAYKKYISNGSARNEEIANHAQQLAESGHNVLINVSRIKHGQNLDSLIDSAEFLSGSDSTEHRNDVLTDFENGDINILISTLIKEGNDIPAISAIIMADAMKSDIATIQVIGRSLRPSDNDTARIVNVRDYGRYFKDSFNVRQETMANYYGKYFTGDYEKTDDSSVKKPTDLTKEPPSFEEIFDEL